MATRYWIGGTGNWDDVTTTHWSADGITGGASVPTTSDDVIFNSGSGSGTVAITATNANCKTITTTGSSVTITNAASTLNVTGTSVVLSSAVSFSSASTINCNGNVSVNFTSAGAAIGGLTLSGNTSSFILLQDALNCSGPIIINAGTFTTNNYAVTATQLVSSNSNVRTINLGSSTLTFSTTATAVSLQTNTNLTFNADTSTIIVSGANANLTGGSASATGVTFNNVSFTATTAGTLAINGTNTFNNLSIAAPSTAGVMQLIFDSPQTINGTLSTTSTAGNRRVWFRGATYGLAQTLTINGSTSLTDSDFRDIYVIGTAAPISGTRIGDLRGNSGITFSAPKTVYWNLAGAQTWSANGWAATSTGTPSTDYFPLAQDTATFTNAGSVTGQITMDSAIPYTGTVDMSGRTSAMTIIGASTVYSIYGDWKNGSGTTLSGAFGHTFSGRNTQTITSAGKAFSGNITIDSYGGTVQLADAFSCGGNNLTVTNGTFTTNGYAVTAGSLSSSSSNVRTINLGASTVSVSGTNSIIFSNPVNLTFNCGTSQINTTIASTATFSGGGQTFYNVAFTNPNPTRSITITGLNTFNNLTVNSSGSAGIVSLIVGTPQIINGTMTCAGATAVSRIFVLSDAIGSTRTLTVNSLSADDCDFRDITIAGAAAGTSPTRAGDCGGNSGITFPAPKTVYWNLSGSQVWGATAWATSSGGTPNVDNYPLPQDTAVLNDAGSIGTITITGSTYNIGTLDMSGRTSAANLSINAVTMFGSLTLGSGVTTTGTQAITFAGRGTQTITSAGKSITNDITVDCYSGTVQLADALTLTSVRTLTLTSGTFDAVSYNVTTGLVSTGSSSIVKMGSGTWTLSGTGTVWNFTNIPSAFYKGTANIVLSDTSTTARTFTGGGLSYNKLTIGGTTGISTTTISNGGGQFTELASTKTVAHTIALGALAQTIGKWSVTGTAGNVVTVTGTAALTIAGAAVSGVDYLAMGTITLSTTSPAEFYAGANSTGTGTGITKTAAPSPRTLYWVGGTGNWSDTAHWSTTSGSGSGAAIPTSLDSVNFDSGSNATAYTVTINPTQARCAALNIAGPASGNVTIAGTGGLALAGNTTIAATGISVSYTGNITLSGAGSYTFTNNGVALASNTEVNGVGCSWTLGSAYTNPGTLTVTNGTFDTGGYATSAGTLVSNNSNSRTINLNASTFTCVTGFVTFSNSTNLTFNCGTSTITCSINTVILDGGLGQTFYNINRTAVANNGSFSVFGENTFNNVTISGPTAATMRLVTLSANQTINGTLTLSAGTDATCRTFVRSDTIGTTRTLTCNAVASLTDIDFRDITIAGNAVSGGNLTGTRLGDCKGNTGITFDAPKTVYWRQTGSANWGASTSSWSLTLGGALSHLAFPLAQDTAIFDSAYPNAANTVTVNSNYNIGTIDMSARTSNTMTLATSTNTPTIYGNWINGTGTTLTGTGILTFAGRGSQAITSAGKTFTQPFVINTPSGSVTLQDALVNDRTASVIQMTAGNFSDGGYNVTFTNTASGFNCTSSTATRSVSINGILTIAGTNGWITSGITGLTVTGTGTISLTNASAKTFAGGDLSYSGITLNQGGAGTLTISGNNTFGNITNTYSATGAATINIGTTTQTVNNFTATGSSGKVLTVQGTSASSPGTLIITGPTVSVDYVNVIGIRAYSSSRVYFGKNSNNLGSLGILFTGPTRYRLTNTGNLMVSSSSTFDEVTQNKFSMSPTKVYASQFDEVSIANGSVAMRNLNTGAIQIAGYFDEVSDIV